MLLQFKFKNFKSFADETVLNMTASNIKEHSKSVIRHNDKKILPVAAIFGANGSGKSNIINAFKTMRYEVLDVYKENSPHFIDSFAFIDKNTAPTEFEVSIIIEHYEYRYGFSRDIDRIYEEWLFLKEVKEKEERAIFYRTNNKVKIEIQDEKTKKEIEYVGSMINDNSLIITS